MATVDEILTRQAYAAGDETWTKDNNYPSYTMYAEPEYVPVTNKRIADFNDQVSVRGEQNAQFVGFQLPRYDDAMDLSTQNLYIHYQTVYGGSDGVPCNVSWSDNYVRMCWMIPGQATQEPGSIQTMIYATGTNSVGDRTIWKTLPATYTIHDGLEIGGGIPEPDPSWYEQFVAQMEGKVFTAQGYANDAQASKTAAAGSATAAAQSADASAQALQENKDYVESQKETFVGYNKRETDLKYANALIGSASGTGRVSVGDAWEAPIPDLRISGESEQVSTTGAQLLQDSNIYPGFLTNANGTRTNDNNYRTVWLSLPIGTYTLSVPGGVMIVKTVIDGILNNSSTSIADGAGYTCTLTQDGFLGISFRKQDSLDYTTEPQVMLNTGSTAKPWEPYTGGQPSPSPDYPQPIISTGTVTTGAQMLDIKDKNYVYLGISMTVNNGVSALKGTATDNATLWYAGTYLSSEVLFTLPPGTYTVTDCQLWWSDGTDRVTQKGTFTVAEPFEVTGVSTVTYSKGKIVEETLYPMLNAGSTPKPWEPYTGGKPSPSEDYPQPLDVIVKGAQLFNAAGLTNKNTEMTIQDFGKSIAVSGSKSFCYAGVSIPPELVAGRTLTLSGEIYNNNAKIRATIQVLAELLDKTEYYNISATGKTTFTIPEDVKKVTFGLYPNNTSDVLETPNTVIFKDVMLNYGDTVKTWQSYQSKTATIQLTAPLYGIGEYRDRIMCKDGEWGIERYRPVSVFDGSTDEKWNEASTNDAAKKRYNCKVGGRAADLIHQTALCSHFPLIGAGATLKNVRGFTIANDYIQVYLDGRPLEEFKTWLQEHPITLVYQLDTPTWTPLPAATQTALNALTTFTGTTHITITAGGPEPDVAVEYVQDTKAVIADIMAQINEIRGGTT